MIMKISQNYRRMLQKLVPRLRSLLIIQGVLWCIAAVSLLLLPGVEFADVVLMGILGMIFIGSGMSVRKQPWIRKTNMTSVGIELDTEARADEMQNYTLQNDIS